jgi:hypothetical protein
MRMDGADAAGGDDDEVDAIYCNKLININNTTKEWQGIYTQTTLINDT